MDSPSSGTPTGRRHSFFLSDSDDGALPPLTACPPRRPEAPACACSSGAAPSLMPCSRSISAAQPWRLPASPPRPPAPVSLCASPAAALSSDLFSPVSPPSPFAQPFTPRPVHHRARSLSSLPESFSSLSTTLSSHHHRHD